MKKNILVVVFVIGRGEIIVCVIGIRDFEENRIKLYSIVFININKYVIIVVCFMYFIMYDLMISL